MFICRHPKGRFFVVQNYRKGDGMLILKTVIIASLIGGCTGVISHLIRNKKVLILPTKRVKPKGYHLGFIADFLIGATAAVFAVTYFGTSPEDFKNLIGISILAGLSAENILLQNELNTEKAKREGLSNIQDRL